MNKNKLPLKWMLGILIILTAIVYWTHQANGTAYYFLNKNRALSPIIQFLANMLGIQGPISSSGGLSQGNDIVKQNESLPPARGHVQDRITENVSSGTIPSEIGLNTQATQGAKPIAEQETNAAQQGNNSGNAPGIYAGNNAGSNTENNSGDNSEADANQKQGNLSEANAENNPGNLSEINSENNSGNNSGINSENNANNNLGDLSGVNAVQTPGNNSGDNSGNNSGSNPGSYSGSYSGTNSGGFSPCVQGCYPGCIPGCDPTCTPGCQLGNINPNGLPTINSIPNDTAVSQTVANQNQQNQTLEDLLATREALTRQVLDQFQATKYQTVDPNNIPTPSTNPAPSDIIQKLKANKISLH